MHRGRTNHTTRILLVAIFLTGCFFLFVSPAMAADDGNIRISSSPPATDACLDSTANSGNCIAFDTSGNAQFSNVAGNTDHTISVWLDGYQPYIVTVDVPSGQIVEIGAVLQPITRETLVPQPAPAPGFLDGIIAALRNLFGSGHAGPVNPPQPFQPTTAITTTPAATPVPSQKIIAAYFYLFDGAYDAAMSVRDEIPWKKVNRVYIAFATVHDGVLTDLPVGSSAADSAKREENRAKIRNVIALVRQANPDAEIFIVSNFGGRDMDDEYLRAAQDPQKFADSVVTYLKEYGLDGYDMDWESSNIDDYAPQLTSLLSTCHTTFAAAGNNQHGRPRLLTHTVWPGVESAQTVAGLKDSVDQLNLMTYGSGDRYDLVSYADAYHQAGVPYGMMIGGLESENGYTDGGGPDTQESVAAKCAYVKQNNLAGLFEWRMDNDMRTGDGPPTFPITGWMSDCLSG